MRIFAMGHSVTEIWPWVGKQYAIMPGTTVHERKDEGLDQVGCYMLIQFLALLAGVRFIIGYYFYNQQAGVFLYVLLELHLCSLHRILPI